jgi:phytoene synthase
VRGARSDCGALEIPRVGGAEFRAGRRRQQAAAAVLVGHALSVWLSSCCASHGAMRAARAIPARTRVAPTLGRGGLARRRTAGAPSRSLRTAVRARASSVEEAFERCGRFTRASSATFYFATLLMRPTQRRSVWAIYAWCRVLDETVDGVEAANAGSAAASARLDAIEKQLVRLFEPTDEDDGDANVAAGAIDLASSDDAERDASTVALAATIRATPGMEPAPFLDMIAGMRSDLDDERLETVPERASEPAGHASSRSVSSRFDSWPSLRTYCYRVAGTVGLMTLPVMGVAEGYSVADAVSAGVDLGIALQLCNIIRDVGEDARRGRLYIPADELRDAGLTPEEVMAGVCDERYAALMETQMRRAEEHFERAKEGTKMLAPAARIPVLAAAEAYGALVDKVRENGYDNHTKRAYTTTAEKLALLPRVIRRAMVER